MIRIALPASLLALAACAPAAEAPPQGSGEQPAAYMALGTEPGWTLEITPSRLNYNGDYGETKIMVPNPGAKPSFNGERYVTDRLKVDITHTECSDGMSDRRYRDTVTVTVTADGKTVKGCGGKILPPTELAGTNWSFVSIGGVPVAADQPTSLQFDGNRMSGSAGCNRFSGTYSVDGGTLKAGPLMATEMACPGMELEQAFFKLMASPVSLTFADDGTLILTGSEGRTAVLKRVI